MRKNRKKGSWILPLIIIVVVLLLAYKGYIPLDAFAPAGTPAPTAQQTAPAPTAEQTAPDNTPVPTVAPAQTNTPEDEGIAEDGSYTSPEEVALYIHTYGRLPDNFLTKNEAQKLGWVASKGNLWDVTDHMSIGGDKFGNREGLLPKANGRQWYECDVNYTGGHRGAERILFSNDGLIYYTDDHYESFTALY